MRLLCLGPALAGFLVLNLYAADQPNGKPKFDGTWQFSAEKSELKVLKPASLRLTVVQPAQAEIQMLELLKTGDGKELKRDYKCNTVGKDCDYTDSGQPSKVSVYYNGPKLVAIERIGKDSDTVTKRTYSLSDDGSVLTVEIMQLVPPRAETDKIVFTKQQQ